MMKRIILILTILSATLTVYGKKTTAPQLDLKSFNEKAKTAQWLYRYDKIAWWTSDSVLTQSKDELKRLGNAWFCYELPDETWHAIYGKFENNTFDLVFHFLVDTTNTVSRIYDKVDTTLLNGYSRALATANQQIKTIKDSSGIQFNQYILQNADKSYNV